MRRDIKQFCAAWDIRDNSYVFVAYAGPTGLGDEDVWILMPSWGDVEMTVGAPLSWDKRSRKQQ